MAGILDRIHTQDSEGNMRLQPNDISSALHAYAGGYFAKAPDGTVRTKAQQKLALADAIDEVYVADGYAPLRTEDKVGPSSLNAFTVRIDDIAGLAGKLEFVAECQALMYWMSRRGVGPSQKNKAFTPGLVARELLGEPYDEESSSSSESGPEARQ